MPELALWKWLLAALCAFSIGVAKTGVPGLGILAIPLFVLTVGDARLSAAWLLPILITADVFAVMIYRRKAAAGALVSLLPWVLLGMTAGALILRYPDRVIRPIVGAITLAMLLVFVWRRLRPTTATPASTSYAGFFGIAAGFATMVANAAGPVMSIYLLSKKLPREEFVATGAWFFFFVNTSKIPVYAAHGLFSRESLLFDAALIPAAVCGALVGRKLLHRISESLFTGAVVALAFIATVLLFLPSE